MPFPTLCRLAALYARLCRRHQALIGRKQFEMAASTMQRAQRVYLCLVEVAHQACHPVARQPVKVIDVPEWAVSAVYL